ncbi:hypothetical protein CRYUN_Cryun19dG0026600 [Craigia yunnanensis]
MCTPWTLTRCDKDRQLNLSSTVSKNTASVENGSDNSSWTRFSDEEYIVFCFREDGVFDVVKDNSKSEESNQSSRSARPVNRKVNYIVTCFSSFWHFSLFNITKQLGWEQLNYAEDAERDNQSSDEGRSNKD